LTIDAAISQLETTKEAAWKEGFARLLKYVEEHKSIPSQNYKEPDGYKLGGWVTEQRSNNRRGRLLSSEQKTRLESIEGWVWWNTKEAAWKEGFASLLKYVEKHGDALVPASYKDPDGYKLGGWVNSQCRRGNRGKLSPERKARLESVEGWTWWNTKEAAWEKGFERLQRYVKEHGNTLVPRGYKDPDGYRLGRWSDEQRSKRTRESISPERKARLESVEGWVWKAKMGPAPKNR